MARVFPSLCCFIDGHALLNLDDDHFFVLVLGIQKGEFERVDAVSIGVPVEYCEDATRVAV